MATHSSIPAWEIPWTEEPGGLQSIVSQRVDDSTTTATAHKLVQQEKSDILGRQACKHRHKSLVNHQFR